MKPERLLFYTAVLACTICTSTAKAETPVDITLNGSYIKTASHGFIDDGSVMLPVRSIAETFGCNSVNWNETEKKVTVEYDENLLDIYAGTKNAKINNEAVTMPKQAQIVDGRAYVSVRFICDFFDADVKWNELTHTVVITKDGFEVNKKHIDNSYTSSDLEWLAKIVHAEAGGEPDDGKVAVANVVLNRKKHREFPNTIYDVVFDRKYGVQFTPVANGAIYNKPSVNSYHSAKKALFGKNVVGESLYFCNLSISTNFWIPNNRPFFTKIGKHSFYL